MKHKESESFGDPWTPLPRGPGCDVRRLGQFATTAMYAFVLPFAFLGCSRRSIVDEARAAGLTPADFPEVTANIFEPMDGGIQLSSEEIMGRNTWILWSAGNDHFWNEAAQDSFGWVDLLKMLDNRKYPRTQRFNILGLINQPGFQAPAKADKFGLMLDEQTAPEPAGIDEKVYGKPSGVIGFRLFPNPEFNEEARQKWDGNRFLNDPGYYNDKRLVRPYRVGVACAACHVAPNPDKPPLDPNNPAWENLASAIGNQYISEGKVFACNVEEGGFFYEELRTQPRGTSDTSRIATDHLNNPSSIRPLFLIGERERIAATETLGPDLLASLGQQHEMPAPHILKDGADSVGIPGAVLRVYVNIGMFSEYWLTRHKRLVGLSPQQPFETAYAQENSVYWQATVQRAGHIAAFFRKLQPFHLIDAPGGKGYITADDKVMARGKAVFAENCASCHSSKQPPPPIAPGSDEAKAWFRAAVLEPDFLENNFLSNDRRYPLITIGTNSARAFGTNAIAGHVWDNFSSQTYKDLSPPDELEFYNPFAPANQIRFKPKEKHTGPGYYRVPSLVNIWSSAPFFHNNSLGKFTGDPSVPGRMAAFQDAIEKLLWPEKRLGKESILRTQEECTLRLRREFLPEPLQGLADASGYLQIGHIPKGTPINLIANLEPEPSELVPLAGKLSATLVIISKSGLSPEASAKELLKAVPELLAANKCPDFIEDEGHYFGTNLSDADKQALIEFIKTF
ncbi:MAG: cytochrome c [Verrucomicrobia bacterium]|nr:cytochrome c [Verrucomicrobiota bacterium]